MTDRRACIAVVDEIRNTVTAMERVGIKGFDCSAETLRRLDGWGKGDTRTLPEDLLGIRGDLGDCTRCPLHEGRKHIVFGAGDPHARLVFVGEGPGHDEDLQGEPFVGAAGQLLTRIIEAMNLTRDQVYICNVVKCRPPGNRNPLPLEIATCLPFLKRQIAAIGPEVVCALGNVAARTLLNTGESISRMRGRFHDRVDGLEGIRVMPTYHPAFLLRNAGKKREAWEDVQQIMKALGLKVRDGG